MKKIDCQDQITLELQIDALRAAELEGHLYPLEKAIRLCIPVPPDINAEELLALRDLIDWHEVTSVSEEISLMSLIEEHLDSGRLSYLWEPSNSYIKTFQIHVLYQLGISLNEILYEQDENLKKKKNIVAKTLSLSEERYIGSDLPITKWQMDATVLFLGSLKNTYEETISFAQKRLIMKLSEFSLQKESSLISVAAALKSLEYNPKELYHRIFLKYSEIVFSQIPEIEAKKAVITTKKLSPTRSDIPDCDPHFTPKAYKWWPTPSTPKEKLIYKAGLDILKWAKEIAKINPHVTYRQLIEDKNIKRRWKQLMLELEDLAVKRMASAPPRRLFVNAQDNIPIYSQSKSSSSNSR